MNAHKRKLFRRVALLLVLCAVPVVAYFFAPSPATEFRAAYAAYETISTTQDSAAFYPAAPNNQVRRDLNQVLSSILVDNITPSERQDLAQRGLVLLNEAETQIDAMGDTVRQVEGSIERMRESTSFFDTQKVRTTRATIVALAEERAVLVSDIRGFSYKANFHTEEIFRRILADKGVLTPAHTALLNSQIPMVEEQFDTRSNLYKSLEERGNAIRSAYAGFDD
jgi:hypothetical protein